MILFLLFRIIILQLGNAKFNRKISFVLHFRSEIEQQQHQQQQQLSEELFETTMTVETQQNHNRLIGGKNGMIANNLLPANSNGLKRTASSQQKHEEYKRMTENTMSVCNVNLMENNLASRYVCVCV